MHFRAERGNFGGLALDSFALGFALSEAGGGHSLADAAFGGEFAITMLDIFGQPRVNLMAKADGHIGQLFVVHAGEQRLVVFVAAVSAAEVMQLLKAGIASVPFGEAFAFKVVEIVFEEFFVASTGDAEEFQFDFRRGLSVAAAFGDVLLGAAGGLYHLVDGAVTVRWQIALAEMLRELVEDIAALIEAQLGINDGLAKGAGCSVGITAIGGRFAGLSGESGISGISGVSGWIIAICHEMTILP